MLIIRSYAPADFEKVVALWEACELTRPWNDPASDIEFCLGSENSTLMVGIAGAESQAMATAMIGHDGHRGWICYVAVAPEHQEKGAGREMMAHAEAWLTQRGVAKAMLMIGETKRKVIGFYTAAWRCGRRAGGHGAVVDETASCVIDTRSTTG